MPGELIKLDRTAERNSGIISGGLMGLAVVALVQMLSLNSLDGALKVSVFSFAISIPALSVNLLSLMDDAEFGFKIDARYMNLVYWSGALASIVGLSGIFFHLSAYAGILFVGASLIGLVFSVIYQSELRRVKEP